jgi:hypothetical protein
VNKDGRHDLGLPCPRGRLRVATQPDVDSGYISHIIVL